MLVLQLFEYLGLPRARGTLQKHNVAPVELGQDVLIVPGWNEGAEFRAWKSTSTK